MSIREVFEAWYESVPEEIKKEAALEERIKHVEDDVHELTKDLLELIQYLRNTKPGLTHSKGGAMSIDPYYKELKDGLPMPDGTVVPSKNDYYRANESKESFVKRLRDAQKHYMDSTNPKHPNYSPEMCEYFRGKAHGLMIAADFVESWLSDY